MISNILKFFACALAYCVSYAVIAFAADPAPVPVKVVERVALPPEVWIALITMIGGTIATMVSAFVQIRNGKMVSQAARGIDTAQVEIVKASVAVDENKKEVAGMHSSINSKMDALLKATRDLAMLEGRDKERAAQALKQIENLGVTTSQAAQTANKAPEILQTAALEAKNVLALAEEEAKEKLRRARDLLQEARLAVNIEATNSIKKEIKTTEGEIKKEISATETEIMSELTRKKEAIKAEIESAGTEVIGEIEKKKNGD